MYNLTKGQAAIRDWFRASNDRTGNLPMFPGIFPDQLAPIVRNGVEGKRELVMARWGMPGPPQFGGAPITNIRNVSSPHWRGWLGKHNRCIVPATSFCEYADTRPRKTPKWFALGQDRPLFAFAGLWTPWRRMRGPKSAPVDGQHELFGFLTTEANAVVVPIHPKAMPVILTTPEEVDLWLRADAPKALELQRPLPDDMVVSLRAENGRMGHGRMQRLTGVESRCDRFRGLREDKPPEQIIVRKRLDPQRMIAESGRHRHVVQVTARNASGR